MIPCIRLRSVACLLAAAVLTAGCDREPAPTATTPDLVVAEDRLGAVTLADVDAFILGLPPEQRWQKDVEAADYYASIARRIAVDRLLLDEAGLVGADQDPRFELVQRSIERQVYSDHYLSELPEEEPFTQDELRAYYEEHREERYELPERRQTFHLFKRFSADGREATLAELEQLRQRVLAGESFANLAREHSESETRHRDGLIGQVVRGQFSPDFDEVVFSLAEETASEPVSAGDGAHLFYVARVFEARSFSFEEVQLAILRELAEERLRQRLRQAAAELSPPEDHFLPDHEEIGRILRLGDRAAVLLRLDDFRLTIEQFSEALAARRRELGARSKPDLPFQLIDEIRDREIIYQHLRREGPPEIPQETIARQRQQQLVDYFARQKMVAQLESQPEVVRQHYADNSMRFATPVRIRTTWLEVDLGSNPSARMAELENARAELDAGGSTLASLAQRLGGELRELEPVTAGQLQVADPDALKFAFQLKSGEHSPPYQRRGKLTMFRVDERQEPEARPLATIWDQVVQDYVANYAPQLFEDVSQQMLDEAGFRLFRERLSELGPLVGS